jgi:hypothetical protein
LTPQKEDAVAEAKERIDCILLRFENWRLPGMNRRTPRRDATLASLWGAYRGEEVK